MNLNVKHEVELPIHEENLKRNRKKYTKPAIVKEFEIETRAGSPLKVDPLDPNSWDAPNW